MGVSLKLAASWKESSHSKADSLGHGLVWVSEGKTVTGL